jgi:AmiR/NasT family two-component response regulator
MARHKVTDTQAFDMLRTASQRRHVKLRELAEDVLLTGELMYSPKDSGRSTG